MPYVLQLLETLSPSPYRALPLIATEEQLPLYWIPASNIRLLIFPDPMFLPRDAMLARYMLSLCVCLSVCLFVLAAFSVMKHDMT